MAMQSSAMDGMIAALTAHLSTFIPILLPVQVYCQAVYYYHSSHTQGELLQGKALQDFVIDKIDDLKEESRRLYELEKLWS